MTKEHKGMQVLRKLLKDMRWDAQDGYLDVNAEGKFQGFHSQGLPLATPDEINALFDMAGIVPDRIVPKGICSDCRHACPDGQERGYSMPCIVCRHPQMSEFGAMRKGTKRTPRQEYPTGDCQCLVCKRTAKTQRKKISQ